jgi:glycosyltransferase involved in cell wall biosynthesis
VTSNEPIRRIKILIALQYYLPHRTGYSIHIQRVAERLAERGHQVTVVTARHSKELPRDETVNNVRIVRLWAPIRISRGMVMPAYPVALVSFLREAEVIWLSTPMLETALNAVLAKLVGRKVIATHHGDLILPTGLVNRFIRWFTYQNYAIMARLAYRIIGYSHDYADHSYYLQPFRDKVSIIYPPIKIPEPEPERVRELRQKWQRADGPLIGYAGRFVKEKRPDLLLKSLEFINEKYPNARVVFAGEYDIRYEDTWENNQYLVEQYRDQLEFLGLLTSQQDMANFYAAIDVLVLPSDTECFALVQVEAMLCGTPVIMTDTPGGRVPVTETGMGKIVPRGNWKAIGQAVIDVLDNLDDYIKPRADIERIFNFGETVRRYEKYLTRAAGYDYPDDSVEIE